MDNEHPLIEEILAFWFSKPVSQRWYSSTPELDTRIRQRFAGVWDQAKAGEFADWRQSARGCLALVILMDQLPLNMFRGSAQSFATEQQAVQVTLHAIEAGFVAELSPPEQAFLFMPLMHSENLQHQDLAVQVFEQYKLEDNLRFANHHREIVRKFGRFPHRNEILGRVSSHQELEYLASKNAFKG